MKIFISWSGTRSKLVAEALRTWLNDVIQLLEPWVSSQDIDKGARWSSDIAHQLEESSIGIICLTRENIDASWILFEAGALAKTIDRTFVCTYLLDLKPAELQGPLIQFQATVANKEDTLKLLQTINKALGEKARSNEQLEKAFRKWWPELEKVLITIPKSESSLQSLRSDRDLLEEIVDLARSIVIEKEQTDAFSSAFISKNRSLTDISQDRAVSSFALKSNLTGRQDEANAINWFNNITEGRQDSLDGIWFSRWNGGYSGVNWEVGTASLHTIKNSVYILHTSSRWAYLIAANKEGRNKLVGRYFNLLNPSESTPWVGLIVSPERIDGQWADGRWDFRRALGK